MDRPRSPVQDAGLWVRSIPPLGCPPVAKHEERGRLPRSWERRPRSLAPIRLSGQWRPTEPPDAAAPHFGLRALGYRRFTGWFKRPVMNGNSCWSLLL